jgi:hypothetical protein
MKQAIMKKWVKALRSGEYPQGRGQLLDEKGGYCCLGVLCDLAMMEGVTDFTPKGIPNRNKYGGSYEFLPTEVKKWAGMKTENGSLRNIEIETPWGYTVSSLTEFNDEMKYDFDKLADVIEENWRKL